MAAGIVASLRGTDLDRLRRRIGEEALRRDNLAMARLLERMCGAVVELDAKFCVTGSAPKLSALLMLDANRSLHGQRFDSFMPFEEDRRRFEALAV
eukprot:CAMPEP_0198526312 /NCGR_PEP_ID=MMETSP1462-20131121/23890_1 /TAXON_ID=1333877 /ORGANISM="Brandtodinium nutriculum, Strain RCC3387" /LENGTH=95 /DNA_ID=CAMNT_0044256087 /DNA_START=154 /DNA_END=438 /DNA_ORIENTATION=+